MLATEQHRLTQRYRLPDFIRPVLQVTPLLEIHFCEGITSIPVFLSKQRFIKD